MTTLTLIIDNKKGRSRQLGAALSVVFLSFKKPVNALWTYIIISSFSGHWQSAIHQSGQHSAQHPYESGRR